MTFDVDLELDEAGWWVATVHGLTGCSTQGRSVRQALRRTEDAIRVCSPADAEVTLRPHIRLEDDVRGVVHDFETARSGAARASKRLSGATRDAVDSLVGETGLSVRDAADILGLSHQRVHQVAAEMRDAEQIG